VRTKLARYRGYIGLTGMSKSSSEQTLDKPGMRPLWLQLLTVVIATVRLVVITGVFYGLLTVVAFWSIQNIQPTQQSTSDGAQQILRLQELDRYYLQALVTHSLQNDKTDIGTKLSMIEYRRLNSQLEKHYWQEIQDKQRSPFPVRVKKSNLSKTEIQDNLVYQSAILSFERGLSLLWISELVLLVLLALIATVRNVEERYSTMGSLLKWAVGFVVFGLGLFAILPQVYFSTYLRPGQELLPMGFDVKQGFGQGLMFVFDIAFVIGFAGIASQFGWRNLFQKTPEEEMIHLSERFPWYQVFTLGFVRSAGQLMNMMPFIVTAVLFANARMDRSEGVYKLVQEVFRSDQPARSLQALIVTTVLVLFLNTLGKRLLVGVQEMLYTIPASKEIR